MLVPDGNGGGRGHARSVRVGHESGREDNKSIRVRHKSGREDNKSERGGQESVRDEKNHAANIMGSIAKITDRPRRQ